ncbi:hypothetical protein BGZ70_007973 [Mortierella alpina]|uniref:Uncharacterized protein n=1 Tax=Mortierella alpina TaxID=64518 RepID=A0A9P6M1G4_MORAP|nr:hypothetical protein BGZ70_007973 [Mortierella alpina]
MLLIKSLVVLCSAAVVTARLFPYDAVATGALLLGKDTTDPNAPPRDVYSESRNHAMAVASVVVHAANLVSFDPSGQLSYGDTYSRFKEKATTFPAFIREFERSKELKFSGHHELRQKVADIYDEFVPGGEGLKVAVIVTDVVGNHLEDPRPKHWGFTTIVICQLESSVQLGLVELSVRGGSSLETVNHRESDHTAILTVSNYLVIPQVFQGNADSLAQKISKVTIANFMEFFTTGPSKDSLKAWLNIDQGQDTEQIPFTRRPHALYPRM